MLNVTLQKTPFPQSPLIHTLQNFHIMMLKSTIVAVLATFALSCVAAEDTRMDYKLAKGQTVAEFCAAWNKECYK